MKGSVGFSVAKQRAGSAAPGRWRQALVVVALLGVAITGAQPAEAGKLLHGTKFEVAYRGNVTVLCRLDYSLQYSVTQLLCENRTNVFQFLPGVGAKDLGRNDGSIRFPTTAPYIVPGDFWSRGSFFCHPLTYGRVRCIEIGGLHYHWMTIAGAFMNHGSIT
jgi:hypothetical protein